MRKVFLITSAVLLCLMAAGCGSDRSHNTVTGTVSSLDYIDLTAATSSPPETPAEELSLVPVAGMTVSLYFIDAQGEQTGEVLVETQTDDSGVFSIELPQGIEPGDPGLMVSTGSGENLMRALVASLAVELDPYAEHAVRNIIANEVPWDDVSADYVDYLRQASTQELTHNLLFEPVTIDQLVAHREIFQSGGASYETTIVNLTDHDVNIKVYANHLFWNAVESKGTVAAGGTRAFNTGGWCPASVVGEMIDANNQKVKLAPISIRSGNEVKLGGGTASCWDSTWYVSIDSEYAFFSEDKLNGIGRLSLRGVDLREVDLSGIDLASADMRNANLSGVDLSGIDLASADLSNANLSGADLSGANLSGADLSRANLTGADLRSANLSNIVLIEANLSNANMDSVDLTGVQLQSSNLTNANLRYADLTNASLGDADLSSAKLTDANLSDAFLINTNLTGAFLFRANLRYAKLFKANLSDADVSNADLSNADLTNANLSNARLSYSDLSNANLSNANLSNASLFGANLSGATWTDGSICQPDWPVSPTGQCLQ